jgi:hypothetical protein
MTFLDTLPADQVLEALTSLEAIRIYVIILCVLFILMAVAIVFSSSTTTTLVVGDPGDKFLSRSEQKKQAKARARHHLDVTSTPALFTAPVGVRLFFIGSADVSNERQCHGSSFPDPQRD